MRSYKQNLAAWAEYATKRSATWPTIQEELTKDQLLEMLNILAGYFGATKQGKKIIESWL